MYMCIELRVRYEEVYTYVCMCVCVCVYAYTHSYWLILLVLLQRKWSSSFPGSSICSNLYICNGVQCCCDLWKGCDVAYWKYIHFIHMGWCICMYIYIYVYTYLYAIWCDIAMIVWIVVLSSSISNIHVYEFIHIHMYDMYTYMHALWRDGAWIARANRAPKQISSKS